MTSARAAASGEVLFTCLLADLFFPKGVAEPLPTAEPSLAESSLPRALFVDDLAVANPGIVVDVVVVEVVLCLTNIVILMDYYPLKNHGY